MSASKTDRQFMKDAQVGEWGSTAMSNPVQEVSRFHQRLIDTSGPMAATTAGSDYRFCGWTAPVACKIISVRIQPGGSLTANDTNYTTVALVSNNDQGGTDTTIASATTKTSGSGGTGNWSANQSINVPVTAANAAVAAGQAVQFTLTHAGTGVVVPVNTYLQVVYEEV